jgi:hypothetical protein
MQEIQGKKLFVLKGNRQQHILSQFEVTVLEATDLPGRGVKLVLAYRGNPVTVWVRHRNRLADRAFRATFGSDPTQTLRLGVTRSGL